MEQQLGRRSAGTHRKDAAQGGAKSRAVAFAVATGAVAVAASGPAIAHAQNVAQHSKAEAHEAPSLELTAQNSNLQGAENAAAPQVLSVANVKNFNDVTKQVSKAIEFNNERVAADLAARAPMSSTPTHGTLTSPFGPRWGTFHPGIDLANSIGTPILAVMDGKVIDSGPASGFGQWIRILHDDGTMTVYGHMETLDVKVGDHVKAGQKIAGMGSRGFSTGSHLHFEVHPNQGAAIDPVPWLAEHGVNVGGSA